MTFIDAHLHFWNRDRFSYPWLEGDTGLPRVFEPDRLPPSPEAPSAAVFVQADCLPEQGVDEAVWAAGLVRELPAGGAVVAFAPVEVPDRLDESLQRLVALPGVAGVRRLLQDESDEFIGGRALADGVSAVAAAGLRFDACIRHRQLPALLTLRRASPEAGIVLDHLGKPPIAAGWGAPEAVAWLEGIRALAREENTVIKLSGVAPEAGPEAVLEKARPFLEAALEAFGPERAMAGSDWPVSDLTPDGPSYGEWFRFLADDLGLGADGRRAVMGGTAVRFYGLEEPAA